MRPRTDDEILEDLKDWPVRNIYVERGVKLIEQLRQRVAELEKETKQLRDLQYELMRSGALVAIEKCKNATGQRRVIDMYVSANQIAEDLLNAMDRGA